MWVRLSGVTVCGVKVLSRIPFEGAYARRAGLAALGYLAASGLWVWITDRLVDQWFNSASGGPQTAKGLLFVVGTTLYWFLMLRRFSPTTGAQEELDGSPCRPRPALPALPALPWHHGLVDGHPTPAAWPSPPVTGGSTPLSGHATPMTAYFMPAIGNATTVVGHPSPAAEGSSVASGHLDPLTGLPTRTFLTTRLTALLEAGLGGALIVLDVDGMQLINESFGEEEGDCVLRKVASALKKTAPPGALAVRLEGDEFGLLLPGESPEGGRRAAVGVGQRLAADGQSRQRGGVLTFCAGVVPVEPGITAGEALLTGELVLRQAHGTGRGEVRVLTAEDELAKVRTTVRWGLRLDEALHGGSLHLEYQPVVELESGRVVHAEALMRLADDTGKVEPASSFLHAAEQFRLMPQIDRWVLEQVLRELKQHPDLCLFVNLSGQSLRDPEQLAWLASRLQGAGPAVGRLTFEITETEAGGDPVQLRRWMEEMTRLGCRFALDDLGHGFSSLAHFTSLPLAYVKIDGSFVVDIDRNPRNRLLVEAVAKIAQQMGIRVVAEWVESASVMHVLREIGVDMGQGFFLGRPGPLRETMLDLADPLCQFH